MKLIVTSAFTHQYQNQFSLQNKITTITTNPKYKWINTPPLNLEQYQSMDKPFTTEVLQNALKKQLQSNPNSSPGKDGLTLPFLKAIFPQIEEQLVTTFNNLTTTTDLPQQMKPVILKFTPKPGKPTNNINNYRPIALIPTISRLLSKIIANRLQPILDYIILHHKPKPTL
ncbi:unnamed protein product [Ambrosiozyma monospora]|uniref:Unnamed protein product n=1 Tax=Ambrosiozyma monospora TaxID=43982 RepID=A0ACB5SS35_AMBMO|nr:unnamed protein product [Ambrosiozyma monospora]